MCCLKGRKVFGGKFGFFFTRIRVVNFSVTVLAMLGRGHGTLKSVLGLSREPGRGGNCSQKKAVGFDRGYLCP